MGGSPIGLAGEPAQNRGVAELVIALNPDEDSRLPYLLRIPQPGGDLLFRTSGTWPRAKALYCYPVGLDEWSSNASQCGRASAAVRPST